MDLNLLAEVTDGKELEKPNMVAVQEVVNTGSILPLTKRIMHDTIQLRRLKRGQPEMVLEPTKAEKLELTEEEKIKRDKRKESNRISAMKYRQKQREIKKDLFRRNHELKRALEIKDEEIQRLESEKRRYNICFDWTRHETFCTNQACKMAFEE